MGVVDLVRVRREDAGNARRVDEQVGVFSADPNEVDDAQRYDRLTAGELVDVISSIETAAGSNAPVDLLAAKIIERSGLRAVVLDGTDPDRIADAVAGDDVDGTEVVPNE